MSKSLTRLLLQPHAVSNIGSRPATTPVYIAPDTGSLMAASGGRDSRPSGALAPPSATPFASSARTNTVLPYNRHAPHTLRSWRAQVTASCSAAGMSALLRRPTPLDADEHLRALEAKGRGPVDAHAAAASHVLYLEQCPCKGCPTLDPLLPSKVRSQEVLARLLKQHSCIDLTFGAASIMPPLQPLMSPGC